MRACVRSKSYGGKIIAEDESSVFACVISWSMDSIAEGVALSLEERIVSISDVYSPMRL